MSYDKRLFAFGCSFTKYNWRTYADFLGEDYNEYYNYGHVGAGNMQIAITLSEMILEHDINANDRVLLQWSDFDREDRYITWNPRNAIELTSPEWTGFGHIHNQPYLTKEWVAQYTSHEHFVKRDLAYMHYAESLLRKIPHITLILSKPNFESIETLEYSLLYADTLNNIDYDMKKEIFNNAWPNRKDKHPTETEAKRLAQTLRKHSWQ